MNDPLSPSAQAVLDAYEKSNDCYREEWGQLASALRAAANQVVPVSDRPDPSNDFEYGQWLAKYITRSYLLAIAAELKALDD